MTLEAMGKCVYNAVVKKNIWQVLLTCFLCGRTWKSHVHLTRAFLSFHSGKTSAKCEAVCTYGLRGHWGLVRVNFFWIWVNFMVPAVQMICRGHRYTEATCCESSSNQVNAWQAPCMVLNNFTKITQTFTTTNYLELSSSGLLDISYVILLWSSKTLSFRIYLLILSSINKERIVVLWILWGLDAELGTQVLRYCRGCTWY